MQIEMAMERAEQKDEPSSSTSTPRSARVRKKSAIAKLAEKKKRSQAGQSDNESNFGSTASLQGLESTAFLPITPSSVRPPPVPTPRSFNLSKSYLKDRNTFPSDRISDSSNDEIERSEYDISSNIDAVLPDPTPRLLAGDVTDLSSQQDTHERTINKLRALRMTQDGSDSFESLKNSQFTPKPPDKNWTLKGEKRFRDPYSSSEENERNVSSANKVKRPLASHDDSLVLNSSSLRNNSYNSPKSELLQNMNHDSDTSKEKQDASQMNTNSSCDSDTEIVAIKSEYKQILTSDSERSTSRKTKGAALLKQETVLSNNFIVEAGNLTLRNSKLDPIVPRSIPPALPQNFSSRVLKTAYKRDSSLDGSKVFSKPPSSISADKSFDTSSQRSLASSSILPLITTKEAKTRSYLVGSISSGGALLGAEELDRYFPDRKLHVFVGSWNTFEIKSCSMALDDFILPDSCEYVQDICVFGTQENSMNKKQWEIRLQETLGPSHVLFHSASHGALHLAVFVRRDLIWFCSVAESDSVTTTSMSMVRTKGALAIAFTFFGTSLLFVNCHFTSSDARIKQRMDNYQKIVRELRLPRAAASNSDNKAEQDDVTARFDSVFWCGDLNFRIEKGRSNVEHMLSSISSQAYPNFEDLIAGDQLTKCIVEGQIFQGFQEGRITFRPTYKFDIDTDNYDTSNKMRIPSYTDRVLFRSKKKNSITCLHYDAVLGIKVSDHKPVFAVFEASLRPGSDNISLAAGHFNRAVYMQAMPRLSPAKLHPHVARVVIDRSLNSLTINFNLINQPGYKLPGRTSNNKDISMTNAAMVRSLHGILAHLQALRRANSRRASYRDASSRSQKASSVCSIQ